MDTAITILRFPFGILGTGVLFLWTFVVGGVFCVRFSYYAVLGKKSIINSKVIPDFQRYEGTHIIPEVWEWVS